MASIIGYQSILNHFAGIQRMMREHLFRMPGSSLNATRNCLSDSESVCPGYPVPFADENRFRIILFAVNGLSLREQTLINESGHKDELQGSRRAECSVDRACCDFIHPRGFLSFTRTRTEDVASQRRCGHRGRTSPSHYRCRDRRSTTRVYRRLPIRVTVYQAVS